jgi:hypothetical protein
MVPQKRLINLISRLTMREFLEAINDYRLVSLSFAIFIIIILSLILQMISEFYKNDKR